jgi:hypothetical protein
MGWNKIRRCRKCGAGCPGQSTTCIRCGSAELGSAEGPVQTEPWDICDREVCKRCRICGYRQWHLGRKCLHCGAEELESVIMGISAPDVKWLTDLKSMRDEDVANPSEACPNCQSLGVERGMLHAEICLSPDFRGRITPEMRYGFRCKQCGRFWMSRRARLAYIVARHRPALNPTVHDFEGQMGTNWYFLSQQDRTRDFPSRLRHQVNSYLQALESSSR